VRGLPVIPLFDQDMDHSFAPTKVRAATGAQRPSRAAVRPARWRFTHDGREHVGRGGECLREGLISFARRILTRPIYAKSQFAE
jgi:hypothetical protein